MDRAAREEAGVAAGERGGRLQRGGPRGAARDGARFLAPGVQRAAGRAESFGIAAEGRELLALEKKLQLRESVVLHGSSYGLGAGALEPSVLSVPSAR